MDAAAKTEGAETKGAATEAAAASPNPGGEEVEQRFPVLIIGGGTAGIAVAARLHRMRPDLKIALCDPATKHYYQPLWTLVGGGVGDKQSTEREMRGLIPRGVTFLNQAARSFDPQQHRVSMADGKVYEYDRLVVAPGIQLNWKAVQGLEGQVGRDGLCSNYSFDTVDSTWQNIRDFPGGTAVFTHPDTPIKCGGAPQKIMYLAADHWRRHPPAKEVRIVFCISTPSIFAVKKYADTLLKVVERYGIEVWYQHDLKAVDAAARRATFRKLDTGEDVSLDYQMMHVTPPMGPPDFIAHSPLGGPGGWVDVDKHTLQHDRFPEVFALGDASSLPTSKTGAAIRKQAPVAAANVLAHLEGRELPARYDGYTSCPLVTGYGKLVLAEFDYDKNPQETFPFDQGKERWSMYQLKKHLLPAMYWHGMLKGRA